MESNIKYLIYAKKYVVALQAIHNNMVDIAAKFNCI